MNRNEVLVRYNMEIDGYIKLLYNNVMWNSVQCAENSKMNHSSPNEVIQNNNIIILYSNLKF